MTQVIRVLPLWSNTTPLPRKHRRARGFSDHRHHQGGKPKLTDEDVRAIRLAGEWRWPPAIVGKCFSIHPGYAEMVMRGETHAHVR